MRRRDQSAVVRALAMCAAFTCACLGVARPALAEMRATLNLYGVPGLIEMPAATALPDGEFTLSYGNAGAAGRAALGFQITPWAHGTFRYTGTRGLLLDGFTADQTYFDRSFDLRLTLMHERDWRPSITLGLQDFIGTGTYGAEYITASKQVIPRLRATAGLGWGRLGTQGSLGEPFGPRPTVVVGAGGLPNARQWFRGPVAPFGGLEWQFSDRLGLKIEHSSDAYALELAQGALAQPFARRSSLNFGAEYQVSRDLRVGAYYLYGSVVGVSVNYALNPARPGARGVLGPAPVPVLTRPSRSASPQTWSDDWIADKGIRTGLRDQLAVLLLADGMALEALALSAGGAQLRLRNARYDAEAQAIGRAARSMAAVLPASVETFEIVPVVGGIATSKVTLRRSDVEALEFTPDNAAQLRNRATFADAGALPKGAEPSDGLYPKVGWQIAPYAALTLFDPRNPLRPEAGLRFTGRYDIAPGLSLVGQASYRLAGGLEGFTPLPAGASLAPFRPRTESYRYARNPASIDVLLLNWQTRAGPDIYTRASLGYLERGFAGVSGEVLWKPVNSRFALGAEVNYLVQRSFDAPLGLGNDAALTGLGDDPFLSGHVSAYYQLENGFMTRLDVGRYLAKDLGATLTVEREFANGWRVGAFATLTDMSAAEFGEGSFDKGLLLTIPLAWATGTPTRTQNNVVLRPLQRDGGARVDVPGRLYDTVRSYHGKRLDDQWSRVWR